MDIKTQRILPSDPLWEKTAVFADNCSWAIAGKNMAKKLRANEFYDYEAAFATTVDGEVAGFCTLTKDDYIPDCDFTPWIGFVFVGERFRGNRISQKNIDHALAYAREQGFDEVYISTDEHGLYEKYGFKFVKMLKNYAGGEEQILVYNFE